MIALVREVGARLIGLATVAVVLIYLANHFPSVSPAVKTLLVGLCIVAPGAGIALHLLDS